MIKRREENAAKAAKEKAEYEARLAKE